MAPRRRQVQRTETVTETVNREGEFIDHVNVQRGKDRRSTEKVQTISIDKFQENESINLKELSDPAIINEVSKYIVKNITFKVNEAVNIRYQTIYYGPKNNNFSQQYNVSNIDRNFKHQIENFGYRWCHYNKILDNLLSNNELDYLFSNKEINKEKLNKEEINNIIMNELHNYTESRNQNIVIKNTEGDTVKVKGRVFKTEAQDYKSHKRRYEILESSLNPESEEFKNNVITYLFNKTDELIKSIKYYKRLLSATGNKENTVENILENLEGVELYKNLLIKTYLKPIDNEEEFEIGDSNLTKEENMLKNNIAKTLLMYLRQMAKSIDGHYKEDTEKRVRSFTVTIKFMNASNLYHFNYDEKNNPLEVYFNLSDCLLNTKGKQCIYTSKAQDYFCIFYAVLFGYLRQTYHSTYATVKYKEKIEKFIIDNPIKELFNWINDFIAEHGYKNTHELICVDVAYNFLHFIHNKLEFNCESIEYLSVQLKENNDKPTANTKSHITKKKIALCIFNYDHHSFYVNSFSERNLKGIKNNFIPNSLTRDAITTAIPSNRLGLREMSNDVRTQLAKKPAGRGMKAIVCCFDVETVNISVGNYNLFCTTKEYWKKDSIINVGKKQTIKGLTELDFQLFEVSYTPASKIDGYGDINFIPLDENGEKTVDFENSLYSSSIDKENPVERFTDACYNAGWNLLNNNSRMKNSDVYIYAHNGAKFDFPVIANYLNNLGYVLKRVDGAGKDLPVYQLSWKNTVYRATKMENGIKKVLKNNEWQEMKDENDISYEITMSITFHFLDSMKSFTANASLDQFCKTNGVPNKYAKYSLSDKQKKKFFEKHDKLWKNYISSYLPNHNMNCRNYVLENYGKLPEEGFKTIPKMDIPIPGNTFNEQFEEYGKNDVYGLTLAIQNFSKSIVGLDRTIPELAQNPIGKVSSASLANKVINWVLNKYEVDIFKNKWFDQIHHDYAADGGVSLNTSPGFIQVDKIPDKVVREDQLDILNKIRENTEIPEKSEEIVYNDAVSLYPSAMWLFKYPVKLVRYKENNNLYNKRIWADKINSIKSLEDAKEVIDDDYTATFKVKLYHTEGMIPCKPKHTKDGLKYEHFNKKNAEEVYLTLVDLVRCKYFNNAKFKILDLMIFTQDYIFREIIEKLFNLRADCKKTMKQYSNDSNDFSILNQKQELYKLIMNSMYGKLLQRCFDEKITEGSLIAEFLYSMEYNGQTLNVFKERKVQSTKAHIGANILSYSKFHMNQVISKLGAPDNENDAKQYNNFLSIEYPIYSTDTDSFSCDKKAFEKAANYLKLPGENKLGGFHPDVEVEYKDEKGDIKFADNVEIIAAVWVVSKTYCYLARGKDKNGDYVYGYHRRGKGLPSKWLNHFNFLDYLEITRNCEDRSVKKYTEINNISNSDYITFKKHKEIGYVSEEKFDRSFPYFLNIAKQRKIDSGITDMLPYNPKYLPSN